MKALNTKAELLKEIERLRELHKKTEQDLNLRVAGVSLEAQGNNLHMVVTAPGVSDEATFGLIVANHMATMLQGVMKVGEAVLLGKTK